jgi:poly-D-alanine transfer protein DltD
MKHFQEEITSAYEKCKNDLVLAQQKLEYLQNVEFREYTEQIADLKHMLHSKNSHESRRDSLNREERPAFSSLSHRNPKKQVERRLPSKGSDRRDSKTASNIVTLR